MKNKCSCHLPRCKQRRGGKRGELYCHYVWMSLTKPCGSAAACLHPPNPRCLLFSVACLEFLTLPSMFNSPFACLSFPLHPLAALHRSALVLSSISLFCLINTYPVALVFQSVLLHSFLSSPSSEARLWGSTNHTVLYEVTARKPTGTPDADSAMSQQNELQSPSVCPAQHWLNVTGILQRAWLARN